MLFRSDAARQPCDDGRQPNGHQLQRSDEGHGRSSSAELYATKWTRFYGPRRFHDATNGPTGTAPGSTASTAAATTTTTAGSDAARSTQYSPAADSGYGTPDLSIPDNELYVTVPWGPSTTRSAEQFQAAMPAVRQAKNRSAGHDTTAAAGG